ncbi:hypothetical protein CERSUDRAFT_90054 [Gelatoporia subvermispora B]|uniref:DRBM domain-containing protein n=1 Tax=Ceriporiopsis subvermispora (strain B) TaxID=914234 RepID=M2RAQ2_CERS8|nr:hypothetical protein CERSUDRAFT_90054 [Gelatoporia subvermispora B]
MSCHIDNVIATNSPIYWWAELCSHFDDDCIKLVRRIETTGLPQCAGSYSFICVIHFGEDVVPLAVATGTSSVHALQRASLKACAALRPY